MNPEGDGGAYARSKELSLIIPVFPDGKEISRIMCSVIVGIIAHWASDLDRLPLPPNLLTSV